MKIRVKLYASLGAYLPAGAAKNEIDLEAEDGVTPARMIARLGVPEGMCHMVLVNGVYIAPADRPTTALQDGDHLAIWPPVAGG